LRPTITVSTLPIADEITLMAGVGSHYCRIANTLSAEINQIAELQGKVKAKRRLARYRSMYKSPRLIAVSNGVALDLEATFKTKSPIHVIQNPFNAARIKQLASERCNHLPDNYVLHVGRFVPQKRHDLLFDAWAKTKTDTKLVLLTDPCPELFYLAKSKGVLTRLHVAGFQKNPYPWMANARFLVLCSDREGMPNVLIEALLCGTPVISTDCQSGPREILQERLPYALVPCDDANALSERMSAFLSSPPRADEVNLDAYREEIIIEKYLEIARSETKQLDLNNHK
jgi:glycosyltransferase involved in cell wall biosynthesis